MLLVLSNRVFRVSRDEEFILRTGEETPRRERPEEAASTTGSKHRHQSQRVKTLSRGLKAARERTPKNMRFDTPFITGERVQSVKMIFFTEKTENNISEEDEKMVWIREARISTFMQLELEACQEEISWMIKYHNCEALNYARRKSTRRGLLLSLQTTLTIYRAD